MMKRIIVILISLLMVLALTACSNSELVSDKTIETLSISFAPTKDVEEILIAADPLKELLKSKLAEKGYTVENVDVSVGIDQNVPAEAMVSGTIDISILPASVFALYRKDGINLLVETLSSQGVGNAEGKLIEPEDGIAPWDSGITTDANDMVSGCPSLVYVNIATEKGADLYEKATNESLTWDDLNSAKWYVCSQDSYDGYIYPSLWLNKCFGEGIGSTKKTIADLGNVITNGSYEDMISALLENNANVIVGYADLRKGTTSTEQFEKVYVDEISEGKYENIWDIVKVIGVTDRIMNDAVCITDIKIDSKMTPEFVAALQETFIELGQTEEGLDCFSPFDYEGFELGQDSNYDSTVAALTLFK